MLYHGTSPAALKYVYYILRHYEITCFAYTLIDKYLKERKQ